MYPRIVLCRLAESFRNNENLGALTNLMEDRTFSTERVQRRFEEFVAQMSED
jgi:hypothetical protein